MDWSDKPTSPFGNSRCDRAHDRYEWKHWVHVCWIRSAMIGQPVVMGTSDLSAGGIGLISPNMVHPGAVGLVMLIGVDDRVKLHYVEVVHCRYLLGSMSHLVGARWIPEPAEMPDVKAEMTSDGPRIIVGQIRSPRETRARKKAAAIIAGDGRFDGRS